MRETAWEISTENGTTSGLKEVRVNSSGCGVRVKRFEFLAGIWLNRRSEEHRAITS